MSFAPLKQPLGPSNRDRSLAEVVELPPVLAPSLGVPVLFHDGLTDSPGAGQITAWDTHSATIEAPPTTRTLLRWEDRIVIEVSYGENERKARVEGLTLDARVVSVASSRTGYVLEVAFEDDDVNAARLRSYAVGMS
jgi:hypothetical protein